MSAAPWHSAKYPVICAVLFSTVPLWALPVALIPKRGFVWYLGLSNYYYTLPARVLGSRLFPTEEFGTIPSGAAALLAAALLYAVLGAFVGLLLYAARSAAG